MKKFVFIILALLCSSCSDKSGALWFELQNNSSYNVSIIDISGEVVELEPMQNHIVQEMSLGGVPNISIITDDLYQVQFSNEVKLSASFIYAKGQYQVVSQTDTFHHYRYTFTDADYQYALEHGTKLELGE